MLQLANHTALPAKILSLPDPDGVDALHVLVKVTFALTADAPLVDEQRPIVTADEWEGEGDAAWLRRASELHPPKAATDVLLEAVAVTPHARAVTELDVGVAVGPLRRELTVIGDRFYTGLDAPWCTAPTPFTRMPLTPDRAFGGRHATSGLVDPRNPVGVGLAPSNGSDLCGLRLPNVEDAAERMRRVGDRPSPALVTPVAASWSPRAQRAGTYDDAWDRARAPFLPVDFDARFLQVASDGWQVTPHLQGGEPIELRHLAAEPVIRSRVPVTGLRVDALYRGAPCPLAPRIETLHLLPSEGLATLTLRATLRCGHRLLDVAAVEITAARGAP